MRRVVLCTLGVAVLFAMTCVAGADPLPGRDILKFQQLPMIETMIPTMVGGQVEDVTYYGHDELSTAWDMNPYDGIEVYSGRFMADDFADTFDSSIVHMTWWGSYMNRGVEDLRTVDKFLIAFESDVAADDPDNTYPFSHPDCVYDAANPPHTQISLRDPDMQLTPREGTFTERLVGGNPNEPVYEYNAELLCPFEQEPDTVYWLKIVALVDHDPESQLDPLEWGWHNRDYTVKNDLASPNVNPGEQCVGLAGPACTQIWHFQDDAVSGNIANVEILDLCKVHMDQDDSGQSLNDEHYVDLIDGPEGISYYSKDLAFELYTPEPGTLVLLAIGGMMLLICRVRK